jgi:DNA-binding XRE family transcriptional regulator
MYLDLLQREVASKIGVKKDSVYNWERGIEPELRFIPKIIEFLGYIPFDQPTDTVGKACLLQEGERPEL